MPDGAIVLPNIETAPKDYKLAGAQEIQLKTVRAVIDGSGAGSAFLPTLQLLDPNGNVMWEGATSSTVAAGGSADVSWFPSIGASGGGSSTNPIAETAWLNGISGAPLVVPTANATHYVPWLHFQTTNTSVFGTDTTGAASPPYHNAAGDKYVYLNADGAYLCVAFAYWEAGAFAQGMIIDNPGGQWQLDWLAGAESPAEDIFTNVSPLDISPQYGLLSHRMFYVDSSTGAGIIRVLPVQKSGANKNLNNASMGIFYLGGSTANLAVVY